MDFDELIPTFLEITSTDDPQIARSYLEMSGGDLQTAVGLFFENGGAAGQAGASGNAASGSETREDSNDEEVARRMQQEMYQQQDEAPRAPIMPTHDTLVSDYDFGGIAGSAMQRGGLSQERAMFGHSQRGIFNQAEDDEWEDVDGNDDDDDDEEGESDDIDYDDEEWNEISSGEGRTGEVIDLTGPENVRRGHSGDEGSGGNGRRRRASDYRTSTQKRLARMFRPPWDIIEKVDLDSAKKMARAEKKWVLVNIQDVTDFRCQCLNRDFWSSQQVKDLVRENFVFLQYQHDSPNGEMYRNLYPFADYPHIAIVDPWTGERMKMWSQNPEVHKFLEQVVDFMGRFSVDKDKLNPMVQHTKQLDLDAVSEEKQIEMAKQESMGQHTAVDDTDDVVIVERTKTAKEAEAGTTAEAAPKEETYADKIEKLSAEDVADPADGTPSTRIQIRSGLDGKRVVKKFALDDSVKKVFEYAKYAFGESLEGRPFTLKMQRENLWDSVEKSVEAAGLKNASILLDTYDE